MRRCVRACTDSGSERDATPPERRPGSSCFSPFPVGVPHWCFRHQVLLRRLVDYMAQRQNQFQADLLRMMTEVTQVNDFSHLERLEDGKTKAAAARAAVGALRKLAHAHSSIVDEQKKVEERRQKDHQELLRNTAVRERLEKLNEEYMPLLTDLNHQRRGYRLEKILREIFELFDLDPRASFKIEGEQIDGVLCQTRPF